MNRVIFVKMDDKNRIIIPMKIREELDIEKEEIFNIIVHEKKIVLEKAKDYFKGEGK